MSLARQSSRRGMSLIEVMIAIAIVLVLNSVSIAFRIYLRGRKKW